MARIRTRIERLEAQALTEVEEPNPAVLALAALGELHPWLRRRILHRWCRTYSGRAPSAAWLERLERGVLGREGEGAARYTLGERHYACFDGGLWRLPPEPRLERCRWSWPESRTELELGPLGRLEWWGPRPPGEWQVVLRRGGERMAVGNVGHRPVKDLLREARLPPWERRRWPLLFRDHELWAIPGVMLSDAAERWRAEQGGWARYHVALAPPLG
jgi:tRNA(Ile)-lysidine synthase